METVKTQDISTNDLNWKIEYDMDPVSYTHL